MVAPLGSWICAPFQGPLRQLHTPLVLCETHHHAERRRPCSLRAASPGVLSAHTVCTPAALRSGPPQAAAGCARRHVPHRGLSAAAPGPPHTLHPRLPAQLCAGGAGTVSGRRRCWHGCRGVHSRARRGQLLGPPYAGGGVPTDGSCALRIHAGWGPLGCRLLGTKPRPPSYVCAPAASLTLPTRLPPPAATCTSRWCMCWTIASQTLPGVRTDWSPGRPAGLAVLYPACPSRASARGWGLRLRQPARPLLVTPPLAA